MEQWKRFAFSNHGMEAHFRIERLRNGFLLYRCLAARLRGNGGRSSGIAVSPTRVTAFNGNVLDLERLGGRTRARTWDPLIKSSKLALRCNFRICDALRRCFKTPLFVELCRIASQLIEPKHPNIPVRQNRLRTVLVDWLPSNERHSHSPE
jgi:hypothetical protein